jgi:phosphoribosylaminoimidazole-succinocarboxamide synthase
MGSVKDLIVTREPTENLYGNGMFEFSNRYSILDYGVMSEEIPGKGAAECMMTAWTFGELLKGGVIPTHFAGIPNGSSDLKEPTNRMFINFVRKIEPRLEDGKYDYSFFENSRGKEEVYMIPLEVIYRNGVPKGSSLLKRIEKLEREDKQEDLTLLLRKLGLTKKPEEGDLFSNPVIEFTTKYEATDRSVSNYDAFRISGLDLSDFNRLIYLTSATVDFIRTRSQEVGFVNYDGKLEFAYARSVMLADEVATCDGNRFVLDGVQVGKQVIRAWHKRENRKWYEAVEEAKRRARETGELENWQAEVKVESKIMPDDVLNLIGEMYQSASDRWTGLNLFKRRPLEIIVRDLEERGLAA